MTTPADVAAERTTPFPPRFWWLKRLLIAGLVLVVLLPCLWLWWAHVAERRLQSRIDAILARHEPLYPADFDPPTVPDDQNAATYLNAAMAAISPNVDSPANSNLNYAGYPPFPPAWHQLADRAIAADARSLALARQARAFDQVDWGWRMRSPVLKNLSVSSLNSMRALANVLGDAALQAHLHGDDAEAVERIRDLLHESDATNEWGGMLVSRLVAVGIDALGIERLEVMTPDMRIEGAAPESPSTATIHPVPRQVVMDLIRELLDEPRQRQWQRRAMLSERMISLDTTRWMADQSTVLRPMFLLDAARIMDDEAYYLAAVGQPDWPTMQSMLAGRPVGEAPGPTIWASGVKPPRIATPPRFSRPASLLFNFSLDRYFNLEWRITVERRVAAVSLAMQLYRVDHGQWPMNLQVLVPHYLSEVPKNPFVANGQPLNYVILKGVLPDGGDRPMIWFDSTATPVSLQPPATPQFAWRPMDRQWRDLSRWYVSAPATAPSGKTQ
jgi:hypothetical protein